MGILWKRKIALGLAAVLTFYHLPASDFFEVLAAGHEHTEDCYCDGGEWICGKEEEEGHIHLEECYEADDTASPAGARRLICPLEEGHIHTETCICQGGHLICQVDSDPAEGKDGEKLTEIPFLTATPGDAATTTAPGDAAAAVAPGNAATAATPGDAVVTATPGNALLMATPNNARMLADESAAKIGETGYETLSAAITAVEDGETIYLLKDVNENISSGGRNYTLDMQGHTINGGGKGFSYYIYGNSNVTLENGFITGGKYSTGAGLYIYGSEVTARNVTITGNEATQTGGGGIYAYNSTLQAEKLVVENNQGASYGGGIYAYNSTLKGEGLVVEGNSAKYGGGIFVYKGALNGEKVKVSQNISTNDSSNNKHSGGGIDAWESKVTLKDSEISGNQAKTYGGGICLFTNSTMTLEDCRVTDNIVEGGTTPSRIGGGIYADNTCKSLMVARTEIRGNKSHQGGGIYLAGTYDQVVDIQITDSKIIENEAISGAGIYCDYGSVTGSLTMSGSELSSNTGEDGTAIRLITRELKVHMTNCRIEKNQMTDSSGDAVLMSNGCQDVLFENCRIAENHGGAAPIHLMNGTVKFAGSQIVNNTADMAGAFWADGYGNKAIFEDTLVKGNKATGENEIAAGGICIDDGTLELLSGAVYSNKTSGSGRANDLYIGGYYAGGTVMAAHSMTEEKSQIPFDQYVWMDQNSGMKYAETLKLGEEGNQNKKMYLTAVSDVERNVASIDGKDYVSLQDAVNVAEVSGESILLVAGDRDEYGNALLSENIDIKTPIFIRFNGKTITALEENLFTVKSGGKLNLTGTGAFSGKILLEETDAELVIDAKLKEINVELGDGNYITAGNNIDFDSLKIYLPDSIMEYFNTVFMPTAVADDFHAVLLSAATIKKFNKKQKSMNDLVLLKNVGNKGSELIPKIEIVGLDNPLVTIQEKDGNLVLHKKTVSGVFLDGENGSDSDDGLSPNTAVKTFARAKEILVAQGENTILVTGQVDVTGPETWDLAGLTLARWPSYKGQLVTVKSGAELTLENIVIDGGAEYGLTDMQSLISVGRDGKLEIKKGAELKNNHTHSRDYMTFGGAVNSDGTVIIAGGIIENCSAVYGGGIYCEGKLEFIEGDIRGNQAKQVIDYSRPPCGGGILVAMGGTLILNGGNVTGNISEDAGAGGGISVGGNQTALLDGRLKMNGGIIEGNVAESGGGIYVSCESEATITGGTITGNEAKAEWGHAQYAGGGIYVNGDRSGRKHGQLNLQNVIITDNSAEKGGGIGGCDTSHVKIYLDDGGAIYGNNAEQSAEDVSVDGNWVTRDSDVFMSEYMLGGGLNRWLYGKGVKGSQGQEIPVNFLQNVIQVNAKNSHSEGDEDVVRARGLAKVWITGNRSGSAGGGIGTNGNVIIGTNPQETVDISVTKQWNDTGKEDMRPESVKIWLLQNGVPISFVRLSPDTSGQWPTAQFLKQPKKDASGKDYVYTVKEDLEGLEDKYDSQVSRTDSGAGPEFVVTNTPLTTGALKVSKTVTGQGGSTSKEFSFTVTLSDSSIEGAYGDMNFVKGAADFTLKHGESKTARNLPDGTTYTVTEKDDGDGYETTVNGTAGRETQGTIHAAEVAQAEFVNQKDREDPGPDPTPKKGNLTVSKTVSGSGASRQKAFRFTVTLSDPGIQGVYGEMNFVNGTASFTLKHGESKTARDLPEGTGFHVEEEDRSGYTVSVNQSSGYVSEGTILAGETALAAFHNYKGGGDDDDDDDDEPSSTSVVLKAGKTLNGAWPNDRFFTFHLKDRNGNVIQEKRNNSRGEIVFDRLYFSSSGQWIYYITEAAGPEDIIWDHSVYKVKVDVTGSHGNYHAAVTYEKDGQPVNGQPVFANFTKTPGGPNDPGNPGNPGNPGDPGNPGGPGRPGGGRPLDPVPQTGDNTHTELWLWIMCISMIGLCLLRIFRKKGHMVFLALVFLSGALLLKGEWTQGQERKAFEEIRNFVFEDGGQAGSGIDISVAAAAETAETAEPGVKSRLEALYERNPDFAGWLKIAGTRIDYPVMLTPEEPEYYIRRDFEGETSSSGVPFIGEGCEPGSSNLLIYGHNMKNGEMFHDLTKYVDQAYYEEHPVLCFDTPEEEGEYQIIAAFEEEVHYQDETGVFRYYSYGGELSEEQFSEYVEAIKEHSFYDTGVSASYGDQLITLSTCVYNRENGRLVVVARKTGAIG